MEIFDSTLGVAGKVNHDPKLVSKYNALLRLLGTDEMLTQFERWADDEDIQSVISFVEDSLLENGVELPYPKAYRVVMRTTTRQDRVILARSKDEALEIAEGEEWKEKEVVIDNSFTIVED
jgi:hypothetical protein